MKIERLIGQIQSIDKGLKKEANKAVNQLLTIRNWLIGYYIVEYEQQGEDRAEYGDRLLQTLSDKLKKGGLRGYSYTNLSVYRQFFMTFPEILRTVSEEFNHSILQTLSEEFNQLILQTVSGEFESSKFEIAQTLSAQSQTPDLIIKTGAKFSDEKVLLASKMLQSLSFSHITLLLPVDDELKRSFYIIEAIKGTWSVRELKRQINTLLFERCGLSKKPELLIEMTNRKIVTETPQGLVKDIYTFEFLGLPINNAVEESELESALLDHLHEFMLEMGNGFCLEARQKRILIGDEYFFIDLVFYHRILRCHVLIDLKVNEFDHADAGQLNTYINYYKKEVQMDLDNDPIGILMVTNKNEALVEFATAGMDQKIFVSKYLLQLPSKEKLESFLRNELKQL